MKLTLDNGNRDISAFWTKKMSLLECETEDDIRNTYCFKKNYKPSISKCNKCYLVMQKIFTFSY